MSFWKKLKNALNEKVVPSSTKAPESQYTPVLVESLPHEPPMVVKPVLSERVISQDVIGVIREESDKKVTNMEDQLQGSVFDPLDVVAVAPTGVNANKVIRIWPKPHPELGENAWGYATRCTFLTNPSTEKPFFDKNKLGLYPLGSTPKMLPYVYDKRFAHVADMYMYPHDWTTAEEEERKRREDARYQRDYASKPGGGWVSVDK